eukprot:2178164-Amphidinium_carterae.2
MMPKKTCYSLTQSVSATLTSCLHHSKAYTHALQAPESKACYAYNHPGKEPSTGRGGRLQVLQTLGFRQRNTIQQHYIRSGCPL